MATERKKNTHTKVKKELQLNKEYKKVLKKSTLEHLNCNVPLYRYKQKLENKIYYIFLNIIWYMYVYKQLQLYAYLYQRYNNLAFYTILDFNYYLYL